MAKAILIHLFLTFFTAIFSIAAATPTKKKILVAMPAQDFDAKGIRIAMKEWQDQGFEVTLTIPRDREPQQGAITPAHTLVPNGQTWVELLSYYKPWPEIKGTEDLEFDALILWGGNARRIKSPSIKEFTGSESLRRLTLKYFEKNKVIGGFSHGVEALAMTKQTSGASLLLDRYVTGPHSQLLARTPLLLQERITKNRNPVRDIEETILTAVGQNGIFSPEPNRLWGVNPRNLGKGSATVDRNLVTAGSTRSALEFAKEISRQVFQPHLEEKIYHQNYLAGHLNIRIAETYPREKPQFDVLFLQGYYDSNGNYREGVPYGSLASDIAELGGRFITFDWPGHGETYGTLSIIDLFNFTLMSRLISQVEKDTRDSSDPNRPLILMGYSYGAEIGHRMLQLNHTKSKLGSFGRRPIHFISLSPSLEVELMNPLKIGKFGLATAKTLSDHPQYPAKPLGLISPLLHPGSTLPLVMNTFLARRNAHNSQIPVTMVLGGKPGDTKLDHYVKPEGAEEWAKGQKQLSPDAKITIHQLPAMHAVFADKDHGASVRTIIQSSCRNALANLKQ